MNANELADELTKMFRGDEYDRLIHEIPDMLRQQQAEIDALKRHRDRLETLAEKMLQGSGEEECPPTSWWKGDPTCGGITENYGLGKTEDK